MHAAIRLALSLLLQLPLAADRPSDIRPIDLLDKHREAVVRVLATNAAGQSRVGCGVVVDAAGTIATAYELVRDARAARVELSDGTAYDRVTLVGTDGRIALLRTDAPRTRRVKLADSDKVLGIGTRVVVLGGPGGTGRILAGGRVDATVHGKATANAKPPLLQYLVSAPLYVTSWGGPAFTTQGEAVGIITPPLAAGPGSARHGLAPSNAIRSLLADVANARPAGKTLSPLPAAGPPQPRRPPNDVIAGARTIGVWVPFGPETLEPALVAAVKASLPWRVVTDETEAQLLLLVDAMEVTRYRTGPATVAGVSGRHYEVTASLRDARTGDELWTTRKVETPSGAGTPFDEIPARIISSMQKSFGDVIVPAAADPKPSAAPLAARPSPAVTSADLPAGFRVLPAEDLQKLGMTPGKLATIAAGMGTAAQVVGHSEFIEPRTFQVVFTLVLGPVSPLEAAKINLDLSSPDAIVKVLGSGSRAGGVQAPTVIPGLDVIGDRSVGFTAALSAGNPRLRMDMVMAIRDTAIEIVYSLYRDGTQPAAATADIARALDARTIAAFR